MSVNAAAELLGPSAARKDRGKTRSAFQNHEERGRKQPLKAIFQQPVSVRSNHRRPAENTSQFRFRRENDVVPGDFDRMTSNQFIEAESAPFLNAIEGGLPQAIVPGDSPQALCTGLPAFRAVPPQTYPQGLLQNGNRLPTVGFGSRGYPVDIVDGDGCRGIVLC